MSTKITTVRNALSSALAILYPNKFILPNPYILEENGNFLIDGYGVAYRGASADITREFCNVVFIHTYGIILAREMVKNDDDETAVKTEEISLLEDAVTLVKDFDDSDRLGIPEDIRTIDFVSIGDIIHVQGEGEDTYLTTEVSFNIRIAEDF